MIAVRLAQTSSRCDVELRMSSKLRCRLSFGLGRLSGHDNPVRKDRGVCESSGASCAITQYGIEIGPRAYFILSWRSRSSAKTKSGLRLPGRILLLLQQRSDDTQQGGHFGNVQYNRGPVPASDLISAGNVILYYPVASGGDDRDHPIPDGQPEGSRAE